MISWLRPVIRLVLYPQFSPFVSTVEIPICGNEYSTGKGGVIDTVLTRYPKEREIKSVVPQNFPIDAVAVQVYFCIFNNFTPIPGTITQ